MIYKFLDSLELDYKQLLPFLNDEEELTKGEILQRVTGHIDFDVLQGLKELEFEKIGKTPKDELYLL